MFYFNFIKFLLSYDVPIFFILNFSNPKKKKSQIFLKRFLEEINNSLTNFQLTNNIYQVNLKNDYEGNKVFGINALMNGIYQYYLPHKINLDIINNNPPEEELIRAISFSIFFNNIKRKNDILANAKYISQIIIHSTVTLGVFIGFANNLPLADLPILTLLEGGLITSILTVYGIKMTTAKKEEIIKESVKGSIFISFLGGLGFSIGNGLKLIPLVGQIPGGIIDATVAGIIINKIGKYTIDYCEKLFEQKLFIDYIKNSIISINSGVDELLNISKFFQN